jgi:hypothetical protein
MYSQLGGEVYLVIYQVRAQKTCACIVDICMSGSTTIIWEDLCPDSSMGSTPLLRSHYRGVSTFVASGKSKTGGRTDPSHIPRPSVNRTCVDTSSSESCTRALEK